MTTDHDTEPAFGRTEATEALHLRPVMLPYSSPHPEAGTCPPWCWAVDDNAGHGVDVRCHGAIEHSTQITATLATLYDGLSDVGANEARFATVESCLEQNGDQDPAVQIALRQWTYPGPNHEYADILRLTIPDAEELVRVLSHLVDTAKSGQR